MARANLLNTSSKSYLELIGDGKKYRVPQYQRDYSWTEEQWEDLWSDVLGLRSDSELRHYMGALVVEAQSDREFLIIDGQQRFATLSILALAILKRLQKLVDDGVDAAANAERIRQLRSRFVGEKDPTSLTESSKLSLNVNDDGFYQDYLVQLRAPLNPKALPASNRLLWDCLGYFSRKISEDPDLRGSGTALSSLLNEAVARQILFILITVDDDLNAYTVFETLNARGLELSATDLLKNYLFSRVPSQQDLSSLARRWHRLVATVRQEKFPEFLRFHLLCEEPKIRQQRLFKLVREKVRGSAGVFSLLDQLEARAELFAASGDPDHDYWKELKDARPHIQALRLFNVRQQTPAVFAAWEKLPPQEFVRLLRLIEMFAFRYTVIGGLNPNDLEAAYHFVARSLLSGEATTATQAFSHLLPLTPSDEKFVRDFAEVSMKTSGAKQKLVRYVLYKIEALVSGSTRDWNIDPGTIEHILPENPADGWSASIPPDKQSAFTYRLGNMTLLERRKNRDAANKDFAQKRSIYQQSEYRLTRAVDEYAPDEWTTDAIEERQRRLAAKAVQIWRA